MAEVTFPQLIQRACGIDVHLKVVVATIDGAGIQRETRSFKTFTSSLNELKEWLLSNGVTHVGMESTGVYWKPVYKVLEDSIPNVWIVNARHIKNVPGHKTTRWTANGSASFFWQVFSNRAIFLPRAASAS